MTMTPTPSAFLFITSWMLILNERCDKSDTGVLNVLDITATELAFKSIV